MRARSLLALLPVLLLALSAEDCQDNPVSASGVHKAEVTVSTGSDGLTVEQRNVRDRVLNDNKIGAIKHLYVLSSYSGQVIIYSTVRGKVTSSGKRLTPSNVVAGRDGNGFMVPVGDRNHETPEVLGDDGTYGPPNDYLYWWDTKGNYHQLYVTGGMIVTISDVPLAVKSVILQMDLSSQ